jgi:hypothetical protein
MSAQDRILYHIENDRVTLSGSIMREASGIVLVTDKRRWPRLSYGQEAVFRGLLDTPQEQWYADYLRLSAPKHCCAPRTSNRWMPITDHG